MKFSTTIFLPIQACLIIGSLAIAPTPNIDLKNPPREWSKPLNGLTPEFYKDGLYNPICVCNYHSLPRANIAAGAAYLSALGDQLCGTKKLNKMYEDSESAISARGKEPPIPCSKMGELVRKVTDKCPCRYPGSRDPDRVAGYVWFTDRAYFLTLGYRDNPPEG